MEQLYALIMNGNGKYEPSVKGPSFLVRPDHAFFQNGWLDIYGRFTSSIGELFEARRLDNGHYKMRQVFRGRV